VTLVWLAAAWLVGLACGLAGINSPGWDSFAWAGLVLLALALLVPRQTRAIVLLGALLGVGALGLWRTTLSVPTVAALPAGELVAIRGIVLDWPTRGAAADTALVAVEEARTATGWQSATARVRVALPLAPTVGKGDRIEVSGRFEATTQITLVGFREYLLRQGLHGQFSGRQSRVLAVGLRTGPAAWRALGLTALEERLRRNIPGAEGALVAGVLLGDDNYLPTQTKAAFAATSTSHIMALSGWNIAIVAGLCALLGRRLGRGRSRLWLAGSALAIWAFVLFVGASPTLLRAAIMGSLYLLAEAVGRRGDALNALALAAIAMTAFDPNALLDIGFQLSCAATIGLIVAAGPLAQILQRWRFPAFLAAPIGATLAAEWFTLPLSLHHFGRISRVTLPANLLAEPLVAPIMAGGVATALLSLLPGPLATFLGLLTWFPARAMLLVVEGLGALPQVNEPLAMPDWPTVALLYAALGLVSGVSRWWPRGRALLGTARDRLGAPRPPKWPLSPWFLLAGGVVCGIMIGGWVLLLYG
jgi:competence protein ComEC